MESARERAVNARRRAKELGVSLPELAFQSNVHTCGLLVNGHVARVRGSRGRVTLRVKRLDVKVAAFHSDGSQVQ